MSSFRVPLQSDFILQAWSQQVDLVLQPHSADHQWGVKGWLPVSPSALKFVSLICVFASSCQDQYRKGMFHSSSANETFPMCVFSIWSVSNGPRSSLGFPWGFTQAPPPIGPCPSRFSSDFQGLAQKHKVEEKWCVFCWVAQLLLEPFMLICMQVLAVAVGCCLVAVLIRTTE